MSLVEAGALAPKLSVEQVLALVRPALNSGSLLVRFDYEVEPDERSINQLARDLAAHGCTDWDTGSWRAVFFFGDEFVLKVPLDRESVEHSLAEVDHLTRLPGANDIFPKTAHLGDGVLIQEAWPWSEERYAGAREEIQSAATKAGLDPTEIHSWNVGWRGDEWRIIDFAK